MKTSFIVLFLSICIFSFGQSDTNTVESIKIYAVSWNALYTMPRKIDNIKKTHIYYFETKDSDFEKMFLDYSDCINKLSSQKELALKDSIKKNRTNVLAELYFGNKKVVSIFFDNDGNYYFTDKWHVKNYGLYYLLFKYFSNEIIPQAVINDAKKNLKDDFWHYNND